MKLKVLTNNELFVGRDGADDRRARVQVDLVNEMQSDVFLMHEAKGFETSGGAWLFDLEALTDMRGFLALAPLTDQNAIFIRRQLRPVSFEADGANFHHALATLKVALPDSEKAITFISAHLCPKRAGSPTTCI